MFFLVIWVIGLIICLMLDNWYSERKKNEMMGLVDKYFHFSSGYIILTILFLIWLFNKR
jgi:hypothetical protein